MAINDARAVIDALADPTTFYVFGLIAARTSKLGLRVSDRAGSPPYVTPFGLMRETSLSREVVEAAAERLQRAGACLKRSSTTDGDMQAGGSVGLVWPQRRLARMLRAAHDRGPDVESSRLISVC